MRSGGCLISHFLLLQNGGVVVTARDVSARVIILPSYFGTDILDILNLLAVACALGHAVWH